MTMPFYVPPEQAMKDKAEYARKGIARGRSLVATSYEGGILLAAENSSRALHKISEIYDRIAFAGVGRFNEYDQLRVAGVRHADSKGYAYSREDVDARSLANGYAQAIGQVFTHEMKPFEVEILVAEVGAAPAGSTGGDPPARRDQIYHILYDGSMVDEDRFSVLGGEAEVIAQRLESTFQQGWSFQEAVRAAVTALAGPDRRLEAGELEVAVLERGNGRRTFRRVGGPELQAALIGTEAAEDAQA
jgi:proteasome alpha subunit